jgi:Uri superfamily endonuclease
MEQKVHKVDIRVWNKFVDKNNKEINAEAKENDIVIKHNGLLLLLQKENDCNNVIIFRKDKDFTDTRLTILLIILTLYSDYNIQYIRVEGRNNRYNFFYRVFNECFVKDFDIKDRDVFYIDIKGGLKTLIKTINKLKEQDFYKQQNIYNKTQSKNALDKMYFYVSDAVEASIKKKLNGVKRKDMDDLVADATLYIMRRYDKNPKYHIDYLLTAAHFASLYILYNKKQKMLDKELSLETYYTNYYLTNNNEEF